MQSSQLDIASKEDLKEELLKIKQKQKRTADDAKAKSEKVIEAVATVGTAAGLSSWLGSKEKEVRKATPDFDSLSPEDQSKKLAAAQGIGGFDYDALIGVAGVAVGFTEMAGSSSDLIGAIGQGALAAYAARRMYATAAHAPDEAAE